MPGALDLIGINTLDRLLSYFQATSVRPFVGDTFYQGSSMPHFFFVSSLTGSDSNDGSDPRSPLATINEAFDRVSADRGDMVFLMPGHAETYVAAGGIALDVAGVSVIGLGEGTKRPTLTSGTSTAATVVVSAANITIDNVLFICGVDSQVIALDINTTDCKVTNCEFRNVTGAQVITAIDINGGSANACDRTRIINCQFRQAAVGSARAIELGEVADGVIIAGCIAWGDYDDACIHNPTGKVLTNLLIMDCILSNLQTGDHSIELVSACTGMLVRNMYGNDMTQATGVDPGSCRSYECYHDDTIDVSGILAPAGT